MTKAALLLLTAPLSLWAATPALELLQTECLACHGAARMADLDLRSRSGALAGGGRGPAIVPGHPKQSLLFQVVAGRHEVRMPVGKDPLSGGQLETLRAWIAAGAPWDDAEGDDAQVAPGWWSFQPVERPAPPQVADADHPVDAFILAKLREKNLKPLPAADRTTLARRAYFDLLGVPPSPEDVTEFVADQAPDAFARLVDRLLASPGYGERWGRQWLDVVRYADSGGFETDIYFPNAWRYRDYVIQSFNDDKPYDRFVQEQIAGDELWADDLELRGGYAVPEEKQRALESRIGTGLYATGPIYHEAALDGRQLRYEWMTDAADVTSAAFMGLTLGCARCHDHKFDPLSQRDYHRMMAVFGGSEPRNEPVVHKMNELGFYTGYPKLLKVEEYQKAVKKIDAGARRRVQEQVEAQFDEAALAAADKPRDQRTSAEQNEVMWTG